MTDGESLLAAVIGTPEDDGVRLVYADWLEEHGDPARAEFIRIQIAREILTEADPRWPALVAREKELLTRHARDWQRHRPKWARDDNLHWITDSDAEWYGFRRGFLQGASARDPAFFLSDTAALFALDPVTHLYLASVKGLPRLAQSAEFMRLAGLRFPHYELGDPGVITLCELPPLPRLRHLWLYKNQIGDRGLKALANWPGLATVETLVLSFNDFRAPGLKALMASPYLNKLKSLDLSDLAIAPKTKEALRDRFGGTVEV